MAERMASRERDEGMKEDIWLSRKDIYNIIRCLDSYIIHAEMCGNHLHTDTRMLAEDTAEMLKEKLKKGKVLK